MPPVRNYWNYFLVQSHSELERTSTEVCKSQKSILGYGSFGKNIKLNISKIMTARPKEECDLGLNTNLVLMEIWATICQCFELKWVS